MRLRDVQPRLPQAGIPAVRHRAAADIVPVPALAGMVDVVPAFPADLADAQRLALPLARRRVLLLPDVAR